MRATVHFSKPEEMEVSITLTGRLSEFLDLSQGIANEPFQVSALPLVQQIQKAATTLRARIPIDNPDESE